MSLNHYLIGGSVAGLLLLGRYRMVATFKVKDPLTNVETDTDPTTIVYTRETPDATVTDYTFGADPEVDKLAVGIYACTVPLDQAGRELWAVQGTGACHARDEDALEVDPSLFP